MRHALKKLSTVLGALVLGAAGMAYWQESPPSEARPPVVAARVMPVMPETATAAVQSPVVPDSRQMAQAIERAMVAADPAMRETAFNVLLPELLAHDAHAAASLLDRERSPGARAELREHLARLWVMRDREAAVRWMHELPEEDRREAAVVAMRALAAQSPPQALELTEEFGVGHDDGSRDYLLQILAVEDPEAARHWLATRR